MAHNNEIIIETNSELTQILSQTETRNTEKQTKLLEIKTIMSEMTNNRWN